MTQTLHLVLEHFNTPLIFLARGICDPDSGTWSGPILPLSELGYSRLSSLCASCGF